MIHVTVWNEFLHERMENDIRAIYPEGIHGCIRDFLGTEEDITVRTATLQDPECGLTQEVLDNTDVLLWWAHMKHEDVPDEIAERVQNAVLSGMGAIFLHSAHMSKPFRRLMGTTGHLKWRENGDKERVWVIDPGHPIVQGIGDHLLLPHEETYAEPFGIPEPDKLVFIGAYEGGEVFRAGCCWRRGNGRVFYFQPGHEAFPTYHIPDVQRVIKNAVRWCAPVYRAPLSGCPNVEKPDD